MRSNKPKRGATDRALVQRMLAGDEAAFETFCDDYVPILYRFVQRRLEGDRELSREIVQTTLCKVLPKLGTFRGDAALTTWLCACARNEIAGHFRRGLRAVREVGLEERELASDAPLHPVLGDGPERTALRRETAVLVHEALDSLPPHYGRALEWKYLDRLPVAEIAARLDLGLKAAESLLTRARNSFRTRYRQLAEGAPSTVEPEIAVPRTAV